MSNKAGLSALMASVAFVGTLAAGGVAKADNQLTWGYSTAQVANCVAGVTCNAPGGVNVLDRETLTGFDTSYNIASVYQDDYAGGAYGWAATSVEAGAGEFGLPVLKAIAFGGATGGPPNPTIAVNYALSIGVQGYTNTGSEALIIPLNAFSGLLDYVMSPGFGTVSAALAVTTSAILDPSIAAQWWRPATDATSSGGRFAATCGTAGALAIGNPATAFNTAPGVKQELTISTSSCTGQDDYVLNAGETFYVWSRLSALRVNQGVTDASQTFNIVITPEAQDDFAALAPSLSFASGANLNIPTGAIPEPSTWLMMILGFGGAGAVLRRRRTAIA